MSSSTKVKKVKIDDVDIGMFIVKLDIPWIKSPFFKNSVHIKNQTDINKLRSAGVRMVLIDLERSTHKEKEVQQDTKTSTEEATTKTATESEEAKDATAPQERPSTTMEQEMDAALAIRDRVKSTLTDIMARVEKQGTVDSKELEPLVEDTLASLERNNQAFLNIAHLGKRSAKIADHTVSTFCLALNAAKQQDIDEESLHALGFAALLHEAGWVQTPLDLIGKRKPYTELEQKLISKHVEIGLKLLAGSTLPELTMRIIKEHHELCDGSGYPYGLLQEDIHPLSRLFRVVDSYDERVHQLLDRPGMLPTNALRSLYVEAEQGKYDSAAVSLLISSLGVYPVSSAVLLNTGERAIVVEVPEEDHLRPVILIHYDAHNKPLREPLRIDLRERGANDELERQIESVLDPNNALHDPAHKLKAVPY